MSISSISASIYMSPTSGSSSQSLIAQAFKNLAQALQSNNLTAAQKAYGTLNQALGGQSQSSSNTTLSQALSQIGSDLQSGNLSGAQQTFATMLQQLAEQASAGQLTSGLFASTQATSGTSSTAAASGQGRLNVFA